MKEWPGIPDTEPEVKDSLVYYKEMDKFLSGKTGKCDFTISPLVDVSQHRCKFGPKIQMMRHQEIIPTIVSPESPYRGLLVYHGLGSGKTLTCINVIRNFIQRDPARVILVIVTKNLIGNMWKDINKMTSEQIFGVDYGERDRDSSGKLTLAAEAAQIKFDKDKRKKIDVISRDMMGNRLAGCSKWDRPFNKTDTSQIESKKGCGGIPFGKKKEDTDSDPLFENTLIIIDEIQKFINPDISEGPVHCNLITQAIRRASDIKLVVLTATPMRKEPYELGTLLNLLKNKNSETRFPEVLKTQQVSLGVAGCTRKMLSIIDEEKTEEEFNKIFIEDKDGVKQVKSPEIFLKYIKGLISYYSVDRDMTQFAQKDIMPLQDSSMSDYQYSKWLTARKSEISAATKSTKCEGECDLGEKEKNISCGDTGILNIDKSVNTCAKSRKISNIPTADANYSVIAKNLKDMDKFSPKIKKLLENIRTSVNDGKHFIYTNWALEGVNLISEALRKEGWIEFTATTSNKDKNQIAIRDLLHKDSGNSKNGAAAAGKINRGSWEDNHFYADNNGTTKLQDKDGKPLPPKIQKNRKSFSILDSSADYKEKLIFTFFNEKFNSYGDYVNIIIGDKKYKEGISLKGVNHVHLLEPLDNNSDRDQAIGRAVRWCSHTALPYPDRWRVKVYTYYSSSQHTSKYTPNYISSGISSVKTPRKEITLKDVLESPHKKNSFRDKQSGTEMKSFSGGASKTLKKTKKDKVTKKKTVKHIEICEQFTDKDLCNSTEYCNYDGDKCLPMSTDYHLDKLADRRDLVKKQFLTLMKESAIDCQVFKNMNEPELKCYRPSTYGLNTPQKKTNTTSTHNYDVDNVFIQSYKSRDETDCSKITEHQCKVNPYCYWNDSGFIKQVKHGMRLKSGDYCKKKKLPRMDCTKFNHSKPDCYMDYLCRWDGKCKNRYSSELLDSEFAIQFSTPHKNKLVSQHIYKINNITEEFVSSIIVKEIASLNDVKNKDSLLAVLSNLYVFFNKYPKLSSWKDDLKKQINQLGEKNDLFNDRDILEKIGELLALLKYLSSYKKDVSIIPNKSFVSSDLYLHGNIYEDGKKRITDLNEIYTKINSLTSENNLKVLDYIFKFRFDGIDYVIDTRKMKTGINLHKLNNLNLKKISRVCHKYSYFDLIIEINFNLLFTYINDVSFAIQKDKLGVKNLTTLIYNKEGKQVHSSTQEISQKLSEVSDKKSTLKQKLKKFIPNIHFKTKKNSKKYNKEHRIQESENKKKSSKKILSTKISKKSSHHRKLSSDVFRKEIENKEKCYKKMGAITRCSSDQTCKDKMQKYEECRSLDKNPFKCERYGNIMRFNVCKKK